MHVNLYRDFLEENKELVAEKVLAPIEVNQAPPDWEGLEKAERKLISDGSAIKLGVWGQYIGFVPEHENTVYVDSPLYSLYRWQSIAGGLHLAIASGVVPISDNDVLSNLACETVSRFSDMKLVPTIEEIQSRLAFQALSLAVPDLSELQPEEILEARHHLRSQLSDFRREMRLISGELSRLVSIDSNAARIHLEDKIQPRIDELTNRIKSLRGRLWRKISQSIVFGGGGTPLVCQAVGTPGLIAGIGSALIKIAFDILQYRWDRRDLLLEARNRGLVFLLDVQRKYGRQ